MVGYTVAKGIRCENGQYLYSCGACEFRDSECPYCYGKDLNRCLEAFGSARGQRYYSLLKTILHIQGQSIVQEAQSCIDEYGTLRVMDLVYLSIRFRFGRNRVRPLAEWLEENRIIPTGAYDRMKERGFKPSSVWARVMEVHPRLDA